MSTPFLAELRIMSFGFPPKGWAQCNGQLLPINQNQALFSLLGTTFGGDGRVNFALPDLRGRVPMAWGEGFTLGERGGEYNHTLINSEMAQHIHFMMGKAATADTATPANTTSVAQGRAAIQNPPPVNMFGTGTNNRVFAPNAITLTGGSQAHNNTQPYLTLNICIALQGIFPSQN